MNIHKNFQNTEVVWRPISGTSQQFALESRANHTLYCGSRGPGKCLPVDMPIPTPNGWIRHGELLPGNKVFGSDGKPTTIKEIFDIQTKPVYKLTFNDGSSIEASDEHLWSGTIDRGFPKSWRIFNTLDIKKRIDAGFPVRLPARPVVDYPKSDIPIDPYVLGLWVGDGSASIRIRQPTGNRTKERKGYIVEFGSVDSELVQATIAEGFSVKREDKGFTWLVGKEKHKLALIELELFGTKSETKFIPWRVLFNDTATRVAFLQGLCDTDGTTRKGGARISTCSKRLANDVTTLIRSLGGCARIGIYTPKENHRQKLPIYNVDFSLKEFVPFRLSRKIKTYRKPERLGWFCPSVMSVEYVGDKDTSCIRVEASDSLYVAGRDFIVTHNTDCQLMRFRRNVGIGYGKFWRGIIFDKEYKALDDIISKSNRWFPEFDDGGKFLSSRSDYKWVWPTGEELLFREYKDIKAYMKYHGQEFPFIGFNELTKWATSDCYNKIMSCNRSSFTPEKDNPDLPPIPLEIFSTTNSSGPGHAWVKKRFIDVAPYGKVVKKEVDVFDPKTKKEITVTRTQVSIFGSYKENPFLDPGYIAELASIEDENLRRSYLLGDWNITAGGALSDLWSSRVHVIPRSVIPASWYVDRSFDWGSTDPHATSWWAEANGEEIKLANGNIFCPPRGSLIKIAEWYGSKDGTYGDNKGSQMGAADIAEGIKLREKYLRGELGNIRWVQGEIRPGPADNQIRNVNESSTDTLEKMMADRGVRWTASDKGKGSIAMGLQLIRDRLSAAVKHSVGKSDGPGIYFMDNCRVAIGSWPNLPRDELKPDEVDRNSEHHDFDTGRYRVLASNNRMATSIGASFVGS